MAMYSYNSQEAECGLKELYLEAAIGATGAVGVIARQQGFGAAYPANARSLASIVRNSTGNYTLNLDQRWQACVAYGVSIVGGPTAAGDGVSAFIISRNLNQAQPTIVIEFRAGNAVQTAADPTSGVSIQIYLAMKDSTV